MFITAAREGKNQFILYLGFLFILVIVYSLAQTPALVYITSTGEKSALGQMDAAALGLSPHIFLCLLLLPFVLGFLLFRFVFPIIHARPFKKLITPFGKINWTKILVAALLWIGLFAITELILSQLGYLNYEWNFSAKDFFLLLLISLTILPLQTTLEELLFRAYLMQGIGLASKSKWIPLLITSVLFGLMHSANPETAKYGYGTMMTYYMGMGLMLGVLTLLDNGLELAIGIHAANNIHSACFVTYEGAALKMPAMFKLGAFDIVLVIIMTFIVGLVFSFLMHKIFGLKSIKSLFEPLPQKGERV